MVACSEVGRTRPVRYSLADTAGISVLPRRCTGNEGGRKGR